jgi:hypothetical protein
MDMCDECADDALRSGVFAVADSWDEDVDPWDGEYHDDEWYGEAL